MPMRSTTAKERQPLCWQSYCQTVPLSRQDDDSLTKLTDDGTAPSSRNAERNRDIWAKAGVLVNELARPALFLNLPTRETESYGRPPGEPAYASLRLLLRSPPSWAVANRKVYVCENANVLAVAADHWGSDCAPLVCTDGMPAAAQRCLLSQLAKARARLCYHGDFDWPGLRIGNHVMREHGAQPWRFCAADYAAAVRSVSSLGQPLTGKAVDALWDASLVTAMQQHRISASFARGELPMFLASRHLTRFASKPHFGDGRCASSTRWQGPAAIFSRPRDESIGINSPGQSRSSAGQSKSRGNQMKDSAQKSRSNGNNNTPATASHVERRPPDWRVAVTAVREYSPSFDGCRKQSQGTNPKEKQNMCVQILHTATP